MRNDSAENLLKGFRQEISEGQYLFRITDEIDDMIAAGLLDRQEAGWIEEQLRKDEGML